VVTWDTPCEFILQKRWVVVSDQGKSFSVDMFTKAVDDKGSLKAHTEDTAGL